MKAEFRDSFAKDLKSIKDKNLLNRVKEVVENVEKVASLDEIHNPKKLKGGGNYFRLRIGDYRMGVALENDTIIFVRFLNRKDIYRLSNKSRSNLLDHHHFKSPARSLNSSIQQLVRMSQANESGLELARREIDAFVEHRVEELAVKLAVTL